MKIARLVEPFKIRMEEGPVPVPGKGEVLLKNVYLGICTSDMQIYHGKHAYAKIPVIMGHEESGVIESIGPGVEGWKAGDRVVLQPQLFCGECQPCRTGHKNVCEKLKVTGVHTDGCACEYTVVPAYTLHRIPDSVSLREAALIEPIAVGFGVPRRVSEVTDITGKKVCVVGAGTIGNLVAQAFKCKGAGKVLITDVLQEKLDFALECGIDYAVNTREKSLSDAILECFGPDKADIIVDCAANPFVFNSIMQASRKTSIIVFCGNYKESVTLDVPQIQRREITVLGHMMYIGQEFEDGLKAIGNGSLRTDGLISKEWNFDDYAEAFRYADENPGKIMKMIVKF